MKVIKIDYCTYNLYSLASPVALNNVITITYLRENMGGTVLLPPGNDMMMLMMMMLMIELVGVKSRGQNIF